MRGRERRGEHRYGVLHTQLRHLRYAKHEWQRQAQAGTGRHRQAMPILQRLQVLALAAARGPIGGFHLGRLVDRFTIQTPKSPSATQIHQHVHTRESPESIVQRPASIVQHPASSIQHPASIQETASQLLLSSPV